MKKQIKRVDKAHLVRGASYLLLLFAVCVIPLALAQRNPGKQSTAANTSHSGEQGRRLNRVLVPPAGGVHEAWVARYNGPGNRGDAARAIGLDDLGNVYVAGTSSGSGTNNDYATIKYDSAGQEQWVARYNDPDNFDDDLRAMAVDGSGNVYVTGQSATNGGLLVTDCATVKYNSAGEQQWVARYNVQPRGYTWGQAIAVDNLGNVYVAAYIDTYPGTNTRFFTTIKYNAAGEQQWVAEYQSGTSDDEPAGIAVDGDGNVYVTGITNTCQHGYDYLTLKYNSIGQEQWLARYDGPGHADDFAAAVAVDGTGAVYVTGGSFGTASSDCATIKYNSTGQQQWVARYDQGGSDAANALAIDGSGNVYVTGQISDPNSYADYGTIKYNSAGQQQWVERYTGPSAIGNDIATAIALDDSGDVYVTGTSDSDAVYPYDYATIKYDSAGQQQWVARYDRPGGGNDSAAGIAVDKAGDVYVTGTSYPPEQPFMADYVTIKYAQGPIPYADTG